MLATDVGVDILDTEHGPHTCLAWRMLRSKIDNNTIFLYLPNLSLRIEHLVSKSLYALVVALRVLEEGFETDSGTSGVFVTEFAGFVG